MNTTNTAKVRPTIDYEILSMEKGESFMGRTMDKPSREASIMEIANPMLKGEKIFVDPKELVLASLLLIINLSLLMIVLGRKALRGRKSHQLFINIAVVHVFSAVSIIASNCSEITNDDEMRYLIINNGLLITMFEMLIVMSCERVMAIKYSFKYADVRSRHIVALLACTWILPILYVIMGFLFGFSQEATRIFSTVLINGATITLGTTNLIIYKIAKKHDKFLKENAMVSTKAVKNVKTLKASYVCFAIVASFIVLWTPYCVHNIVWFSRPYDQKRDGDVFSRVVDFIAYLHGIVDPLFFIWLSPATKKEIKRMLNIIRYRSAKKDSERSLQTDTTK